MRHHWSFNAPHVAHAPQVGHRLSQYTWHLRRDFQYLPIFHIFLHRSKGDNHQSTGGRSKTMQGQAKIAVRNSMWHYLHMHQGSPLFLSSFTVIPLLSKVIFIPSIRLNLCVPRTRPPITSAIDTLLTIRPFFQHAQNFSILSALAWLLCFSFSICSSSFCFLLTVFHDTFSMSYKIFTYYVY